MHSTIWLISIHETFGEAKGFVWDVIMSQINTTKGLSMMLVRGQTETLPEDETAR